MTVTEFVKEQIEARAKATSVLAEPLEINGISIDAGCRENGIEVDKGITKLANILGVVLAVTREPFESSHYECIQTTSFEFCGTRFFQTDYISKGETDV